MKLILGAFIVLLLLLQYEFWFSDGGMRTVWSLQRNIADQNKINAQLEQRNQVLIAQIKDLQSGDAAIEAHARNDLGMIKKDEVFYRVIQPKNVSESVSVRKKMFQKIKP
ncbi:MAG TPA: cell division protein FtsB [Coxiellaceae bacterium]|nr:cell division protein FtsB [Coxiellaceae bacterium]